MLTVIQRHDARCTAARTRLRSVLDSARTGQITTASRDNELFTVVDAGIVRGHLMRHPSGAVVPAGGSGWAALLPDLPVHGDGATLDEALADLIGALREYTEDGSDRLHLARNHQRFWATVRLVTLSTDHPGLRDWLLATGVPGRPAVTPAGAGSPPGRPAAVGTTGSARSSGGPLCEAPAGGRSPTTHPPPPHRRAAARDR